MTLRPTLFAVALLSALSSAALAQTPGQAPVQTPTPGMAPGGGMGLPRTLEEAQPWADRLFARLDANQDAAITGSELGVLSQGGAGARGGARLRTMIAQSDSSGDARISREELGAGIERMFTRMDRNGDGRLADDELPQPPTPPRPSAVPMPTSEPMPMPDNPAGG